MPQHVEEPNERSRLLSDPVNDRRSSVIQQEEDAQSIIGSYLSKDEHNLLSTSRLGERLPYNDYTTVDWLHDLVCCPAPELKR